MTWRSRLILTALALAGLAQLVPVPRTNPPVERAVTAPPEVVAILRRACFDCHSHETAWAGWQTWIAPASWLVTHDVSEGRRELNFSRWGEGKHADRVGRKIAKEVRAGDMPPLLYVLAHPGARLSAADQATLVAWAATLPGGAER